MKKSISGKVCGRVVASLIMIRRHALMSLVLLGTVLVLITSIGTVHATTVTMVKAHHPPSTFTDPSGTYDGYFAGQTLIWTITINITHSFLPYPWLSIEDLSIIDTLPNLGGGTPIALFMTYVSGSQNSSSAAGAAAFTDFGNGTLLWDFGHGPFTTGVISPPPLSNPNDFYTASITFNATISNNVLDNTFLTNAGVARFTETDSQVHSAPQISDTIWVPRSVLNIVKINPAKVENGSSFDYVLQLSNTGHEDAAGVVVQDIMPTGITHTPPATATSGSFISDTSTNVTWIGTLFNVTNPGNTVNITIPVRANTGLPVVFNSASFITYPSDTTFTNQSANCTTHVIHPAISLTKTPSASKIENGSSVTYNFTVTNTGDTTLTGVNVADSQLGTVTSGQTLTAGQSMSFTKSTTLTANTTNTATATGVDQTGASVSVVATATVQVIHPAITLTETPSAPKVENGMSVTYTYLVTNTGDTPLTVSLTDSAFGVIYSGKVLTAGASNITIINRVLVSNTTNTDTATGVDQTGGTVSARYTTTVTVIHPAITLTIIPSATLVESGSMVNYTYIVTNTGDTTIVVQLTDNVFGTILAPYKVLGVGASNITTISRILTASTTNTANATGWDQTGTSVYATATATVQAYNPANTTLMFVHPPSILVGLNMPFTVNVDVSNVFDLYNWEVKIYYDKTLLNYTGSSEGPFLKSWNDTVWVDNSDSNFNSTHGMVYIGASLLGRIGGVSGNGTLASVSFQALGNTTLTLSEPLMLDSNLNDINFSTQGGSVLVGNENLVVSQVSPNKRIVGHNMPMNFTITVQNQGANTQTFNVSLCLNSTAVAVMPVSDLAPNSSCTFVYTWNASTFPVGYYYVNATADHVPGETNYADNTLVNGTLYVGITGDVNGKMGFPDGKVDMRDIGLVARAFGSSIGSPFYKPECDFNNDGKIDMVDIGIVARHFGDHYP